jgi:two-component system LytT family response regulator
VIRAFVVDDEPLAVKRLVRMLEETRRVQVLGSSTDPVSALAAIEKSAPDVLFLDIQMPGLNGFEMLARLDPQPVAIFTTAYDQYALRAFEVNSIDYLLKPIEERQLTRALDKLERLRGSPSPPPDWNNILAQISCAVGSAPSVYPERIASRVGERIHLLELANITHFFAHDKLTYAVMQGKNFVIDHTVAELEQKVDPRGFCRIHRSTLVNLAWVRELDAWFGGRALVRLKDSKATELQVARDRVAELKKKLGI